LARQVQRDRHVDDEIDLQVALIRMHDRDGGRGVTRRIAGAAGHDAGGRISPTIVARVGRVDRRGMPVAVAVSERMIGPLPGSTPRLSLTEPRSYCSGHRSARRRPPSQSLSARTAYVPE
jgi:hypothetical protein